MIKKSDKIDKIKNYLYIIIAICTILTIVGGVLCMKISNSIAEAINPIVTRVQDGESKLLTHIAISDKCLAEITDKKIFDLTVKQINKDLVEIKLSQNTMENKLDELIKFLLHRKTIKQLQTGDEGN